VAKERTGRLSADETLELWRSYKRTGDVRVRDRLVLTLAPMVKYIVMRKIREIPARYDVDDFISCGLEALIRSIDRYDPDKGASLEQFAWTRIHGAVIDELRRNDWAPRSVRRFDRDLRDAQQRFLAAHGRPATDAEICDALAIEPSELAGRRAEIARAQVGSLNSLVDADDDAPVELIDTLQGEDRYTDPELSAMRTDARERFLAAFRLLTAREQKIAVLVYVHGLTLYEVGDMLGVTNSRICQIRKEINEKLRVHLKSDEQLFAAVA
jgi:RNA polymerase sigma factor for flagellar operon FliA